MLGGMKCRLFGRTGLQVSEVVFGAGKTPSQIVQILDRIAARGQNVLVTRASVEAFEEVQRVVPDARYEPVARCITVARTEAVPLPGRAAVLLAPGARLRIETPGGGGWGRAPAGT